MATVPLPPRPEIPAIPVPPTTEGPQVWLFGRYHLDPSRRRLDCDGHAQELDPRALATLECLLRRAGDVVPRAVVIAEAWPGAAGVPDSSVSKVMRRLRLALGDSRGRVVQTVYGEGYRLALPATPLPALQGGATRRIPLEPPSTPSPARRSVATPLPANGDGPALEARTLPVGPVGGRTRRQDRRWLAWLPWTIAITATAVAASLAWMLLRRGAG